MILLDWHEFIETGNSLGPIAMTIGVFDGIHRGHQTLINSIGRVPGASSCVFTFSGNPILLLAPQKHPGDIMTVSQKITRFRELGTAVLTLIDFSHDFSKLSGKEFLSVVTSRSDLRYLALGRNFRFGYRNDTSAPDAAQILSALHIPVEILPPVLYGDEPISSRRIRKAILDGNLNDATEMLGNPFSLDVSHLEHRLSGEATSVKTGSIRQVLPPPGSYQCLVTADDWKEVMTVSIGPERIEWKQLNEGHVKYIAFT